MDDILTLSQRVENSIALGESHFREFKSAYEGIPKEKRPRRIAQISRDIAEALVAFTNADGGELIIGVEDDGEITGLPFSENNIDLMMKNAEDSIIGYKDILIQIKKVIQIESTRVLFIQVMKSTERIFQLTDGRCMRRQDRSSVPASFEKLQFERAEMVSREFDRSFIDGATVNNLDIGLVQRVADDFLMGISPEQYLQQVNLAEYGMGGFRLRRAALLLFAQDITRWFPRCQVRILKIDGDEILSGEYYNVISDEYVTGNIFCLVTEAWERLRPFLSQKTVFRADARFEQVFAYPENACREALINAIAHRDYSIQNPVTIYIYNNTLVFESPGELLSTISIQDITSCTGVHESRNTNIARVLRESKYMRELGEGMRRIFELFASQELSAPVIKSSHGSFSISMTHQSVYSPKEQAWLNLFKQYDLDTFQKRIVIAGMDGKELSPAVIYAAIGSEDRNLYDRTVTTLRVSRILEEIRTSAQATFESRRRNIRKNHVARFKVVTPDKIEATNPLSNKIYLYNLSDAISKEAIYHALYIFGEVRAVEIPTDDKTGKPRGFAYVSFANADSALRAIAIKNIRIGESLAIILPYRPNYSKKRTLNRDN